MRSVIRGSGFLLAMAFSVSVMAMSLGEAKNRLDDAKQQKLVGETPSGYLAVVRSEGQADEVVTAINEARRSEYARIAQKHGIPVAQVETVAGKKAIEKTPAGQMIQVDGVWVSK